MLRKFHISRTDLLLLLTLLFIALSIYGTIMYVYVDRLARNSIAQKPLLDIEHSVDLKAYAMVEPVELYNNKQELILRNGSTVFITILKNISCIAKRDLRIRIGRGYAKTYYTVMLRIETPLWSKNIVLDEGISYNRTLVLKTAVNVKDVFSYVDKIDSQLGIKSRNIVIGVSYRFFTTFYGKDITKVFEDHATFYLRPSQTTDLLYEAQVLAPRKHEVVYSKYIDVKQFRFGTMVLDPINARYIFIALMAASMTGLVIVQIDYFARYRSSRLPMIVSRSIPVGIDLSRYRCVKCRSYEDIVKLSRMLQKPILRLDHGNRIDLAVVDGDTIYLYEVSITKGDERS